MVISRLAEEAGQIVLATLPTEPSMITLSAPNNLMTEEAEDVDIVILVVFGLIVSVKTVPLGHSVHSFMVISPASVRLFRIDNVVLPLRPAAFTTAIASVSVA